MSKLWIVAQREYMHYLRKRSFLFAAFGVPIFVVVIMMVVFSLADETNGGDPGSIIIGYVDHANVLVSTEGVPDYFVGYDTIEQARQALEDDTIGAYFVLPEQYLANGRVQVFGFDRIPEWVNGEIESFLFTNLSAQIHVDLPFERIEDPVEMTVYVQDSGRELTESAIPALFLIPIVFVMVFMMSSQVTSGFLMGGVSEEKTNRVMEILITSVTPMQLLGGKLIGLGLLGLTQFAVWVVSGMIALTLGQDTPFLSGVSVPTDLIVIALVYFVLGYFLLASVMAGVGAATSSEQEGRQFAGIFSLIVVIPFFFFLQIITEPNGDIPVLLSLIPFTAPVTVIMRSSFGAVPVEQLVLSIGILLVTTILITWLSAKIFRLGILLYGKRMTPHEVWRAIRSSADMGTTVSKEAAL